ncbi:MAG: hypothetical protein ABSG65_19930 [Bryobacteraceae bacterium]|jgi:hypothetical protein
MINLRTLLLALTACAGLGAQCVPGGLAVVVPKASATNGLSMAQLRKLVMGDVHTWPDKSKVTLVSTDSEGAVFKCVLTSVVRMTPPEYKKYVMSAEFRGDEPAHVRVVDSSAAAVRTVAVSAGSFSVVEASALATVGGLVKVLSINGKQPGEPGYPL